MFSSGEYPTRSKVSSKSYRLASDLLHSHLKKLKKKATKEKLPGGRGFLSPPVNLRVLSLIMHPLINKTNQHTLPVAQKF